MTINKLCITCNTILTNYKTRKFCSVKCRIKDVTKREKYKTSQKKYTERQRLKKYNTWETYFSYLAKKPERIKCDLKTKYLIALLKEQNFECAISGIKLTHEEGSPYNASIDRIFPKGTYKIDNIQLVCKCLNTLEEIFLYLNL